MKTAHRSVSANDVRKYELYNLDLKQQHGPNGQFKFPNPDAVPDQEPEKHDNNTGEEEERNELYNEQ